MMHYKAAQGVRTIVILGQSNNDDEQQNCSDFTAIPLIEGKSDHTLGRY